jgi:hypothetical protein
MSTKTTFKRIALVAVAALGLGVLSVAPSSAAVGTISITVDQAGTAALDSSALLGAETSTAAKFSVSSLITGTDSITVQFIATGTNPKDSNVRPLLTLLDSTSAQTVTLATNGIIRGYRASDSVTVGGIIQETTSANNVIGAQFGIYLESSTGGSLVRKAGTYNYLVIVKGYTDGAINDALTATKALTITIAAAASASETPSAAYSAVYLADGATISPTADSATVSAVATASTSTKSANLNVLVRNALNGTSAIDTTTITVTGPGLLYNGSVYTKYLKVIGTSDVNYAIYADGSAGKSTITVSYEVTGQTFTKSINFYAKNATTITPTVRTPALKVGSNSSAVGVSAVDVNGNAWTGTAYVVASSAADALIAGSTTPVACKAWNVVDGIRCDVTGVTAGTAKFKVIDAATVADAKATSAEFSLTVSVATAAAVKVEFDKPSYGPYEKAVITVYPVDATGALIPANTFSNIFASGGISVNQAFSGASDTLTAVDITTASASSSSTGAIALKKVYTVYMPAQGDVTLSWTGGSALPVAGQVKGTATASVVNSSVDAATDAANEATDAANAATDAALAAADAADAATAAAQDASDAVAALSATVAKLVASLKAQITSLTNLVIKIQKKVKA